MFFAPLVFRNFLEEDEKIIKIFRPPFLFPLRSIIIRGLIFGGLAAGLIYLKLWHYLGIWYIDLHWQLAPLLALYLTLTPFFRWYVNGILMSSESLIFVQWPKFFVRKFERIDFHNLDEIEVERVGINSFLLGYGTLRFQKVNGGEQIEVRKLGNPYKVARLIEQYREHCVDNKNFTEESSLKDLLSQMVQTHVGEHGQPVRERDDKGIFKTKDYHFRNWREQSNKQNAWEDQQVTGVERRKAKWEHLNEKFGNGQGTHEYFETSEPVRPAKPAKRTFFQKQKPEVSSESETFYIEKELDDTGGIEIDLNDR